MRLWTSLPPVLMAMLVQAQNGPGGVGTATNIPLWLRADGGPVTSGASITSWNDRGGNNNHCTPPSAAARPTLVPGLLNGYPAALFDGVDDELRAPDNNTLDLQQWDVFLVSAVGSAKNSNAWLAKGTATQPNYALWSPSNNALQLPIYDIFTLLSSPSTGANTMGGSYGLIEYNNTVLFGLFPSRTVYSLGTSIYNDVNLLQLPATNNNALYIGNVQGTTGYYLAGGIAELIVFNTPVNAAQRIILDNYLSAKYGLSLSANDIYVQDDPANGNYDHDVAGIGRTSSSSIQSDSRGTGIVRINNPGGLGNNEFLIWGHDNAILGSWGSTDFPPGLAGRWFRVWRVNEVSATGTPVDVGNVDITFDLTGQGPVVASDLRLLVDANNNGIFADDPAIAGAVSAGGNLYRFSGVSALVNNRRFTLGTIDRNSTPLPITLLYFKAWPQPSGTVQLEWATASEQANDHFTVERSSDGAGWEAVLSMPGAQNSSSTLTYLATDRHPLQGLSYYRLRQTDVDGTSTLSDMVPVQLDDADAGELYLFPDPANDQVTVLCTGPCANGELHLLDPLGREVGRQVDMLDGRAQIALDLVPTGMYTVMLVSDVRVRTKRLMVQH